MANTTHILIDADTTQGLAVQSILDDGQPCVRISIRLGDETAASPLNAAHARVVAAALIRAAERIEDQDD